MVLSFFYKSVRSQEKLLPDQMCISHRRFPALGMDYREIKTEAREQLGGSFENPSLTRRVNCTFMDEYEAAGA